MATLLNKFASWRLNKPILAFLILFILQVILFYIFYRSPWLDKHVFTPLVVFYAQLSGNILQLFGQTVKVMEDTLTNTHGVSMGIMKGCDAAEPMALFIAGIVAFPATVRKKLRGLLVGLILLCLLNFVRIITLFLVGAYLPGIFDTMHLAVWQMIFIVIAIAMWLVWLYWTYRQIGES